MIRNNSSLYKNEDGDPQFFFFFTPKVYRLRILRLFQDENCHVGYNKTLNEISENFWFPSLAAFTKKYNSLSRIVQDLFVFPPKVSIIVDRFTKYCILKPLKTLNGQELVPILRENLTMFGTPMI